MSARTWLWATATAGALLSLVTAPAGAATLGSTAHTVSWSAGYGTAQADGQRWLQKTDPTNVFADLVVSGKLTNSGEGCYSVWTQFTLDLFPLPPFKHAQLCGAGTVDVDLSQSYRPTTTGTIFICKGTENPTDCGAREYITSWPIGSGRAAKQVAALYTASSRP
ncbi:hypothetical protein ACIBCO_38135 [Streptomyces violascens]|uniref:hypothetical protein n=1 Tax=Streptomyces violascens TaxID=67381 RepID=UPI0037928944